MKISSCRCASFSLLPKLFIHLRHLFVLTQVLAVPAYGQLYWKTSAANSWTGSFWGTAPGGPYNSAWVSGSQVIFEDNGGTLLTTTFATTAVGGMQVNENVTLTTGGTFGTGGTVISVEVLAGKTLTFGSQSLSTAAGTGFIKNGGGTWSLNGSPYTGGFTLNAGTMAASGINAMGAGALVINGGGIRSSSTAARDFSGKQTSITIGGDFFLGDATNNGALTFTGPTSLGSSVRTITVNSSVNWNGAISGGGGITKLGAGTLTLKGDSIYTGTTTISAGTLLVTNTSGSGTGTGNVTTVSGTTLGGTGTIAPTTTSSVILGGSVTPGVAGAAGTLTFTPADGNVTFQNTSSIAFELFGNGNNDKIVLVSSGSGLLDVSSMAAGSVSVSFAGGYTPSLGHAFDLLDWSGVSGLSTSLLSLSTTGFDPSWAWDTSQFTTNGTLSVVLVPEPSRIATLAMGLSVALRRRRR